MPQKTVLVVNADPELETILSEVLQPNEWTVERVPDNRTVLARAQLKPFDLIITNEKTSGAEDVELLRKIRRVQPHTRLIILADKTTPQDVIESMRQGAFSYFSTPIPMSSFAEVVRMAANGPCWDDGIEVLSATPAWLRLAARCDRQTADRLLQFIHEFDELPEPERTNVATAFREILLNAMEHGGHFDPEQYVEIGYVRTNRMIMCRVKDPGEGFSLLELRHAAVTNPPDDPIQHLACRQAMGLRPGGFGLMVSQSMVDELIYNEKGNDVLLVKYLDDAAHVPVKRMQIIPEREWRS